MQLSKLYTDGGRWNWSS